LLGSVILADDVAAATSLFLANAPGWPDTLRLASVGRLPLLAPPVVSATLAKLRTDGGKGLHALGSVPASQASTHAIGRLLERWDAGRKLGEALLEGFLRAERDGSAQGTLLERLVAAAPCSMIRVLAHALQSIPKQERSLAMDKLIRCLVSRDTVGLATCVSGAQFAEVVEQALLDHALQATGLDHNFLASKLGASIASLAWANASNPIPECTGRRIRHLRPVIIATPGRRHRAVRRG
jgi:hypothetical protein